MDWLEYRHWRRMAGDPDRTEEVPIRDDDAYNPHESRTLNDVADVMLSCRVRVADAGAATQGTLAVRTTDGRDTFEFFLSIDRYGEPDGVVGVQLLRNSQAIPSAPGHRALGIRLPGEVRLEVSQCDRRMLVAVDGHLVTDYPYDPSPGRRKPTSRPLAIGCEGLSVEVRGLKVLRDVYYVQPSRANAVRDVALPYKLPTDGFYVLGDNSPIADDSRTWPDDAVLPRSRIVGRPLTLP
jgi:hypothetical protein